MTGLSISLTCPALATSAGVPSLQESAVRPTPPTPPAGDDV